MRINTRLLNRGEIGFLAVIVVCLAAALWLLGRDQGAGTVPGGVQQVGTVTFKNHYAERKLTGEVLWGGVSQNAPVYNFDSIRTASESSAVVHLNDKTEISLGEESLVLLDLEPQRTKLNIIGGSVIVQRSAAGGSETPAVVLSTKAGQVALQSGTMAVTDSALGTSLNLSNGAAVFNNGSGDQTMSGDASVGESGKVTAAPQITGTFPPNGGVILVPAGAPEVQFRMTSAGALKTPIYLEVARDRNFAKVESSAKVSGIEASLPLGEGTHYWRVSDAPGNPGAVYWFTLNFISPPRQIAPLSRTFTVTEGTHAAVDFSWTSSAQASSYRLEIGRESQPDVPVFTSMTRFGSMSVDTLGPGDYVWTVSSLSGPDLLESKSAPARFSVATGKLAVASLKAAAGSPTGSTGVQFSTVAVENGAVLASWDQVDGADHYVATVSRDDAGRDVVDTVTTRSNFLQLDKPLDKGTYFVSVRAVSNNELSENSAELQVKITDPVPPIPIGPDSKERLDPTLRDIQFRWADPNQALRYRFQLADNPGFSSPLRDQIVERRDLVVKLPESVQGTLWWKVSVLDDKNAGVVDSGVASPFLPRLLDSPKPISPTSGVRLDINQTEKIPFLWESVPGADGYQVTLYRMTGGLKLPVQSWNNGEKAVVLDHFDGLAVDSYSWELRATSGPASGFLGLSRPVTSYFSIIQSAPLPAPVLKLNLDTGGGQ